MPEPGKKTGSSIRGFGSDSGAGLGPEEDEASRSQEGTEQSSLVSVCSSASFPISPVPGPLRGDFTKLGTTQVNAPFYLDPFLLPPGSSLQEGQV